jgi:DNA-binding MarR family transcriptional regulator
MDTVSVTNVDLTELGRSYVAEARPVLEDMHSLLKEGRSPEKRFGLQEARNELGEQYWLISA